MSSLTEHFERYALVSLEKQARLFSLLGAHVLDLDLDAGIARFNDLAIPFQVLGTESDNALTWLWAWADEQEEVPDSLLTAAKELKAWGGKNDLPELIIPSLDLNRADGMFLSLIASGVCKASGYYRDPYEGGATFLLLHGIALDDRQVFDRTGLVRQIGDLAARYDFNHRNALLSYFTAKSIPVSVAGNTVGAELSSGERLMAEFSSRGQIVTINGEAFLPE